MKQKQASTRWENIWLWAALILLATTLLCSSTGCGRREIIVVSGERNTVYEINEGDPSPIDGLVMTDATYMQLYEAFRWYIAWLETGEAPIESRKRPGATDTNE